MGNPRSPGERSRTARVAAADGRLRTLMFIAAALALAISFALVATYAGTTTPNLAPAANTVVTPAEATTPPAVGSELSRAQAIALVQGRYGARVVRTTLSQDKGGRRLYVFRLLSGNGKVWTVRIDAQTGAEVP